MVARIALVDGAPGLERIGLEVLRPLSPMLASTASSVADALGAVDGPASVEWKLDGVRLQVHRVGPDVRLYTRNLNDVTARLPEVVELVRGLPVEARGARRRDRRRDGEATATAPTSSRT